MFDVRCISPLDDKWEARDVLIEQAAGKKPYKKGAGHSSAMKVGERDLLFLVPDFEQAVELRKRLLKVAGIKRVTLQEHNSQMD